jgi:hypothetical protein
MRIALNIVGVVLVLFGSIWFLQGINVLPGSFMTGQIRWAVYGGIAVIAGIFLLVRLGGDAGAPYFDYPSRSGSQTVKIVAVALSSIGEEPFWK